MKINTKEKMVTKDKGMKINENGKKFEEKIENLIKSYNFIVVKHKDFKKTILLENEFPKNILIKSPPYKSIYKGANTKSDYLLISKNICTTDEFPKNVTSIRIECKYQKVSGSIDEKWLYFLANINNFPENDIIFLYDGGGYRSSAIDYIENVCKKIKNKNVQPMDLEYFQEWLKKSLYSCLT